jgi:four helix bundle protein
MSFLFENLIVYKKALQTTKRILTLTISPPKGCWSLVDQLRRSAMSMPANLAEGSGRWHPKDKRQFFWIARGSAQECVVFIDLAAHLNIISDMEREELRLNLEEIARMIAGLIKSTRNSTKEKSA